MIVIYSTQIVIVGVFRVSRAYGALQGDQIRLLDVITSVNHKSFSDLVFPGMDIQDRFERTVESKDNVRLSIDRSIALPPVSSPLAKGRPT